jgi:hypothetical protein
MWKLARDEVVTKPRRHIQTAKFMLTVLWNPLEFHMIDKLPAATRMNSEYFTINIIARVEEKLFPEGRAAHAKGLSFTWTIVQSTRAEPRKVTRSQATW